MTAQFTSTLFPELEQKAISDDWTFNGASTREYTHCYHDYPARMIPQIAAKLYDKFGKNAKLVFDPYCGTGTSIVEGFIRGIDGIGTDLNPLACMIARAKTTVIEPDIIREAIADFNKFIFKSNPEDLAQPKQIDGIPDLNFWFKKTAIEKLNLIDTFIKQIERDDVRLFFKVAFSETIRESSNTRNSEFKMFRYRPEKLEEFDPDVFGIMSVKLSRNFKGLRDFIRLIDKAERRPTANIYSFNSVVGIPEELVKPESVDIVVTSPPYGDSRTTVAYGQYSRLSAAWLGLGEPAKVDNRLMGGRKHKSISKYPCDVLNSAITEISANDEKRAFDVVAFYSDYLSSIRNVAKTVKRGGHACYVVANRRVKGVTLPTDKATEAFFAECGFDHIDTFKRDIPNKRMPLKNSPTNEPGKVDTTMHREFIVVMRKR